MSKRGYASFGLVRPKFEMNVGAALRAAFAYDVKLVVLEDSRAKVKNCLDTSAAYRHIPVIRNDDMKGVIPYDAVPVAVDLVEGAENLVDFVHPERAFYVFGPEDGTLGSRHLAFCPKRIMIPTRICMNLAATINVVLYDRMAKGL